MNNLPFNFRAPTVSRTRAYWRLFITFWERLGEVHYKLETATDNYDRWRVIWSFRDDGRHVSYRWNSKRLPGSQ